jgi:hypothetical protein
MHLTVENSWLHPNCRVIDTRVMHMKDIIALFIAILLFTIAMIGMASADREVHESVFVGPYELHFYANHHLDFIVDDLSSGGVGRYKVTGYYVGDPDGPKFQIGIIKDTTKKQISQTRKQQMDKMMGLIANAPGYVFKSDDTAFLDDNHQAQIIRYTLEGTLAHEYIGIMLSGTEELLMDAPGPMETGLDDYDYAAVLENIQVIGHDITKFEGESTKPGTLSDATMWNPEIKRKESSDASGKVKWAVSDGGNGHYYRAVMVPEGITWDDANTRARAEGGYLVTITSAAENEFVYNLVAGDDGYWIFESNAYGPWLGGYQPTGSSEPSRGWTWVTGEPFSYTNWWTGEPNNGGSADAEESLHFIGGNALKSPDWNDAPHDFGAKGYIVEFNEVNTKPGTLSDATMWNPEKNQKESWDASGRIEKPNKAPRGVGSGNYPQTLHECEGDIPQVCGTWTLEGDHYNAQWENGASATIKVEKWGTTGVVLTRYDSTGSSAGLSGRYEGQLSGNTIQNGVLTYTYKGFTGSGTWNANW